MKTTIQKFAKMIKNEDGFCKRLAIWKDDDKIFSVLTYFDKTGYIRHLTGVRVQDQEMDFEDYIESWENKGFFSYEEIED